MLLAADVDLVLQATRTPSETRNRRRIGFQSVDERGGDTYLVLAAAPVGMRGDVWRCGVVPEATRAGTVGLMPVPPVGLQARAVSDR